VGSVRIERRPSGGRVYVIAIEDVHDGKRWRKRFIVSFGREGTHRANIRLTGFLHALEGSPEYPTAFPQGLKP
jgi:hypothetical protein